MDINERIPWIFRWIFPNLAMFEQTVSFHILMVDIYIYIVDLPILNPLLHSPPQLVRCITNEEHTFWTYQPT